jgi:hypothetical protein
MPPARRAAAPRPARPVRPAPAARRPVRLTRRGRCVVVLGMTGLMVGGGWLVADGMDAASGPPQPSAAEAALPFTASGSHPAASAAPGPRATASAGAASGGTPSPGASASPSGSPSADALPPAAAPMTASAPVRVTIPHIGVDAPLTEVGLAADGTIQTPPLAEKNLAAWYRDSADPGAQGTSVIVGHVDNTSGPAVFYGLGALKKGNLVDVTRADGRTAEFTVYGIQVFPRATFPAAKVYGPTGHPELRLITCGGSYSKAAGYSGNVVVFARFTHAW